MILALIKEAQDAGARLDAACRIVGLSARTIERWRGDPGAEDGRHGPQRLPSNALSALEQARVVAVMTSPQYCQVPPKPLVPRLADDGIYLASESTMYRLQRRFELRGRTRTTTRTHVTRATTVHRATAPNQVWSWDITYLPTPVRGRFLRLYLVLDVWSRRIVGWKVHERESDELAAEMIRDICYEAKVDSNGLVLHSDNGKPMRGSTMVATLQWLGIVPSFSRPHVSDDNPYSEALFRHAEAWSDLSALALRRPRRRRKLGHSLRRLVQRRASPQRYPVRHARRAALRTRGPHPRATTRPLRTRPPNEAGAMVALVAQLDSRRQRRAQPGANSNGRRRVSGETTTTLTLTVGLKCQGSLRLHTS
jgi:putative transposase